MSQRDLLYIGIAILVVGFLAESFAVDTTQGTWRLDRRGERVDLDLRSGSPLWSWRVRLGVAPGALEGIDLDAIDERGAPLRFALVRPAGKLVFEGTGGRRPSGEWTFHPDESFRQAVEGIAVRAPDDGDLLRMTIDAMPLSLIDGLADLGYDRIDPDHLVRLMNRDISLDHVVAMQRLGYRPRLSDIVRLHDRGMGPGFVEDLLAHGLEGIPVDDLIRIRNHGIDLDYVASMSATGFGPRDLDDLIRLRNHGVSPDYAAAAQRLHDAVRAQEIIRLHNHGIGEGVLEAIRLGGLDDLSVEEIIRLNNNGIGPDFVVAMRAGGYDHLDVEDLVRLSNHGVTAAEAVRLREAGLTDLPAEDLIRMRTQGLPVSTAEEFARIGYGAGDIEDLLRLHRNGVSADLVTGFRDAGFDFSPEELIRLHRAGVTPELARRAIEAGFDDPDAEDLIRIDRIGLDEAVRRRD